MDFRTLLAAEGVGRESIVTDGKLLFTNNEVDRDQIHAFSVTNETDLFTVIERWKAVLPDGHRVRGLSYHAASGLLYMHNGGDGTGEGTDGGATLYAVRASDGSVHRMGAHAARPRVYQVLRHGDELLVFGTSGRLFVYEMTSDTTVGPMKQRFNMGLGELYGAAILDDQLFVTSKGGNLSIFQLAL